MNNLDIQKLIDLPNAAGAVKLPPGEYEGPFSVSRPCTIIGSDTTLWCRDSTVLDIRSKGVSVRDLRAEITGSSGGTAIVCRAGDTSFEDVSVCGDISGIPGEDGRWDIPKVISVGNIAPDTPFSILMEVYVPVPVRLDVNISGISAEPPVLSPGMNTVSLTAEPLSDGTVIYGDMIFRSAFLRRAYLTLSATSSAVSVKPGQYFFRASQNAPAPYTPAPKAAPKVSSFAQASAAPSSSAALRSPHRTAASAGDSVISVVRGQRSAVNDIFRDSEITAELKYSCVGKDLDIDGYAFLLNSAGIAESDKSLIFFGNDSGADGAVTYTDENGHRRFKLELDRIPQNISRIAVAFSVYGDDPAENFSRLRDTTLILKSDQVTAQFLMNGFFLEKTIVAAEFYRKNDIWRFSAVGQGYSNGLKRLCESFGLTII